MTGKVRLRGVAAARISLVYRLVKAGRGISGFKGDRLNSGWRVTVICAKSRRDHFRSGRRGRYRAKLAVAERRQGDWVSIMI